MGGSVMGIRPVAGSRYSDLDKKVREGTYQERSGAIKALTGDGDEKAVRILIWILQNGRSNSSLRPWEVDERALAAAALGHTGGRLALQALESVRGMRGLKADVDYAIREIRKGQDEQALMKDLKIAPISVLAVLTERRIDCAVTFALDLLNSPDIETVVSAARYLGVVRHTPAVDRLVRLLQESEYIDIQHTAAVALGRIGGPKAKAALLDALHHKSEWAVSGAVKGLAFMWSSGESDVLYRITDFRTDCGCSRDDGPEENAQREAVDKMYLAKKAQNQ
jgi:HEAT repeat protein